MSSLGSITGLISRVKEGDTAAADELAIRFFRRLVGLARVKLQGRYLGEADEEDVVQSALAGFFHGAKRGQYARLHDRDDLWHLLVKITTRKVQKFVRHEQAQKRHLGRGRDATPALGSTDLPVAAFGVEQIPDPNPPPDLEVLTKDNIAHLLDCLGDAQLRSIVGFKCEGYTNEEIAAMLGCKCRTVERKLELIRKIWRQEDVS
jgi:RNA polymerase sigma factor (sigma-70 family)